MAIKDLLRFICEPKTEAKSRTNTAIYRKELFSMLTGAKKLIDDTIEMNNLWEASQFGKKIQSLGNDEENGCLNYIQGRLVNFVIFRFRFFSLTACFQNTR